MSGLMREVFKRCSVAARYFTTSQSCYFISQQYLNHKLKGYIGKYEIVLCLCLVSLKAIVTMQVIILCCFVDLQRVHLLLSRIIYK